MECINQLIILIVHKQCGILTTTYKPTLHGVDHLHEEWCLSDHIG